MISRALLPVAAAVLLAACGGGSSSSPPAASKTPTPTPTPAASATPNLAALAALLQGRYQGTWNNTTFNTTGPITVDVKVDQTAGTVSVTLTLGGNVFGGAPPAPETYTFKLDPSQSTYTGKSAIFGDVTTTFALTGLQGNLTMKGTNIPNARVGGFDATGTSTDLKTFSGRYTVSFKDGSPPAQGTFTIAKTG